MKALKWTLRNKRGQASFEVAIAVILLIALLLFAWDMTMIGYNWPALQFAVNEGLRAGAQSSAFDAGEIENYTRTIAKRFGIADPNVVATFAGGMVSVRAEKTVPFTPLTKTIFQLSGLGDGFTVYASGQRSQEPGGV